MLIFKKYFVHKVKAIHNKIALINLSKDCYLLITLYDHTESPFNT